MSRNIQEPVTVKDTHRPSSEHRTTTTHPAYAQIRASRVNGMVDLYGSDFTHHQFITVSICRSSVDRDLSNDWVHPGEELIEVQMSEAQWAAFVSSLNVGGGVRCTLNHFNGESVPQLPRPKPRQDQFSKEMKQTFADAARDLRDLKQTIENMGLPKGKTNTILDALSKVGASFTSSAPFVADQFGEHMEDVMEGIKTEAHGYMTNLLMRAGLDAIATQLPLALENKDVPSGGTTHQLIENKTE